MVQSRWSRRRALVELRGSKEYQEAVVKRGRRRFGVKPLASCPCVRSQCQTRYFDSARTRRRLRLWEGRQRLEQKHIIQGRGWAAVTDARHKQGVSRKDYVKLGKHKKKGCLRNLLPPRSRKRQLSAGSAGSRERPGKAERLGRKRQAELKQLIAAQKLRRKLFARQIFSKELGKARDARLQKGQRMRQISTSAEIKLWREEKERKKAEMEAKKSPMKRETAQKVVINEWLH